jgi:hypothetical protein
MGYWPEEIPGLMNELGRARESLSEIKEFLNFILTVDCSIDYIRDHVKELLGKIK